MFLLLTWHLFADQGDVTRKVFDKIFEALLASRPKTVYVADRELSATLRQSEIVQLVDRPEKASLVLIPTMEAYESLMPILHRTEADAPIVFALSYRVFKNVPESVGALYWKKGRSQLLFLKKRLQHYGIVLPGSYSRYIVDSL